MGGAYASIEVGVVRERLATPPFPPGMKRPLSPSRLLENGRLCLPFGACVELQEASESHAGVQQEKKKLLFSLCEVCNIQLNSAAQAQVHYNGKSHLKRLKQLNNGELPSTPLSTSGSAFTLAVWL
ncbi:putative protein [Scleropages formosus]|uniref:U1-type domain-containing protein n=1 Tax=Scleropages formosus TaxID=113540 RepID=A0A0P7WWZ8_SCLFO|nr:putative protein [Scleropages formosus]